MPPLLSEEQLRQLDNADYKVLSELLHELMTDDDQLATARHGNEGDTSWYFTVQGEFRARAREWVIEDLKKVGFHRISIVGSSEVGERQGITGVRVYAHPEEV